MTGNNLTSVPDLSNLTNLASLSLDDNALTTFPPSILNLSKLQSLWLGDFAAGNQITSIPDNIGQLSNLTRLLLDSNKLTQIPATIYNLTNLTELSINNNQLASLPDNLGNLSKLTTLNLAGNQLTSLPSSLQNLTNLHGFSVSQCLPPTNYPTVLNGLGIVGGALNYETQDQLLLKTGLTPNSIASKTDYNNLNFGNKVTLQSGKSLSSS
ncbi:hypothetical protein AZF37_07695 [endosymbiont 'TC1' of Trimyema compressum]|uniref:leucine-rich repeat domain-containing protein n=1 Tax=endosymbiont 'TC1' of Trimyema compressum TaxID=243899 RepID=UPI0007F04BD7|nr:leucine-rich repeat domain-containing protein [endosymbiont 'TC1' of Trimyema compressum]AMP21062.1 hypothetical protein AZF37_07695 [endosymbiont 'TC1' of Trimyema compressum]